MPQVSSYSNTTGFLRVGPDYRLGDLIMSKWLLLIGAKWGRRALSAGVLALASASENGAGAQFPWPVELRPALSSTFGESRSTAFHVGIDVKTWGRTGYAVQALADGYIWRLRTSPWGYGRAVYHKLADGRILVYAHLERFADKLRRPVEKAQVERQRYSVDLRFAAGQIPVRRGEVIAWSGGSGAGPPHLHVELRDKHNVPLNPLLYGFQVEDTIAPTIARLALVSLDAGSRIDGFYQSRSVPVQWRQDEGHFAAAETLAVYGLVGVAAQIYDRADGASNKLAPLRNMLTVDGRPIFTALYDRISYEDGHQVFLDRRFLDWTGGSGRFFNLHRLSGNRLNLYKGATTGGGILGCGLVGGHIQLAQGRHQLTVETTDAAGNSGRAHLQLLVDAPPVIVDGRLAEAATGLSLVAGFADPDDERLTVELARDTGDGQWRQVDRRMVDSGAVAQWQLDGPATSWRLLVRDDWGLEAWQTWAVADVQGVAPRLQVEYIHGADFAVLDITSDQALAGPPNLRAGPQVLAVEQVASRRYRALVSLQAGGEAKLDIVAEARAPGGGIGNWQGQLAQQLVEPANGGRWSPAEGAALVVPPQAAYEPFFPQGDTFAVVADPHLEVASTGFAFEPAGIAFNRRLEIELGYSQDVARPELLGIYRQGKAGQWHFVGNQLDRSQRLVTATVRHLGRYALLADAQSPRIGPTFPAAGEQWPQGRDRVWARIEDEGAGIGGEEGLVLELDGQRLIAEYDPDAGTLGASLDSMALGLGLHRLVIRVKDASGNEAVERIDFTVD